MHPVRRNLGELVQERSAAFGDAVAFQIRRAFRRETTTFRQAGERARQVAGWLLAHGLVPGDRVAVWAPNMPEYAVLYFGAWTAGIVVVPIDVRTPEDIVDRFIASASPRLVFTSRALKKTFGPPVERTLDLEDLFPLVAGSPPPDPLPSVDGAALAEIAYTSGTTGEPKGVMLTHGNLLSEIEGLSAAFPLKPTYRALSVLPLSHAFELVVGLLLPYYFGVRITYLPRANPVAIARALREDRPTCMILVPQLLKLMLTRIERRVEEQHRQRVWRLMHRVAPRLPIGLRRVLFFPVQAQLGGQLTFIGCGGAPLDLKVAQAWERMGVDILEGYGLTETSAATTINTWTQRRLGTVGKPIPGVELRLGEDDEIQVRGPMVTPGYFQNPERTAQAFVDGWFRTEDIGAFDPDGFLRIVGRTANKIVLPDGRNVYPEDIERVLNEHDLVRESCVIGIPEDGGESVHAVLITRDPARAAEVIRETNRRLAPQQQIRGFTLWEGEDFPRTQTLKIDRKIVREAVLRRRAEATPTPSSAAPAERPAEAEVDRFRALVASVAGRPAAEVREDAELEADLGLDSIGRMELLAAIEETFGRQVDEAVVTPQTTVGELRRLADMGPQAEVGAIPYARWPRAGWARKLRHALLWAAFRLQDRWIQLEIVHPERIGKIPLPSILIFNYQGPYAPLLIVRALPPRARDRVAIAVDARLWRGRDWWQGLLARVTTQAFPLPKGGGAVRPALEAFGRYLDDGYLVITSPEGEPELEGELLPFQRGIGLLAVEMQVPIVPFKIEGYYELFPRNPQFPYLPNRRGRVRLIVGEPITVPKGMSYDEATELIRQHLINTH